ncbi:hypothetical protein MSAN_00608900 [Mycena sanguinolenta]|uniref:Endo-1,3(4)-beta-glucanase 1 carbohydrate binding domain-containing protein n=1 Tax=Mycena sanguinolenta TaxID=230812 RepID=A0A8H6ZAJ1_9AGAR|nr:hypothetical protein MSAN_00608900 [Mycena sanguinolenta]
MARLRSLVFTALFASSAVVAEPLLSCGAANYFPSQYTCDEGFLCPIVDGTPYIKCGNDCYTLTEFTCFDNSLNPPVNPNGPVIPIWCGDFHFFDPSVVVCFDDGFFCPIVDGNATFPCGDTCFTPSESYCDLGQIFPLDS